MRARRRSSSRSGCSSSSADCDTDTSDFSDDLETAFKDFEQETPLAVVQGLAKIASALEGGGFGVHVSVEGGEVVGPEAAEAAVRAVAAARHQAMLQQAIQQALRAARSEALEEARAEAEQAHTIL